MSNVIAHSFSDAASPSLLPPTPISPKGQYSMRRGSLEQGRALEALGHAVEYLVDSRLFGDSSPQDGQEAVQILMRMSRAVFAECPEVVGLRQRVGRWFVDRFAGGPEVAQRG